MTIAERLRDPWSHASSRERVLVVLGTIVVVGALGYAFAWEPLMRDLASTDRALVAGRARVLHSQQAANEIAGLKREAKAPRTTDPRVAAERVVNEAGLRGGLTAIDLRDGRVRLTFAAIDFPVLNALIEQLGRDELLFPVEALVAARVVPGSVRAELALARPATR
jgi:type II secretory pathway component PulM